MQSFINLQTLILERNKETENGTETEIDLLIGNTTVLHTEHQISKATTHGIIHGCEGAEGECDAKYKYILFDKYVFVT